MVIAAVVIGGGVVGGKVAGGVVGSVGMAVVGSMSGSIRKGKHMICTHACSASSIAFSFFEVNHNVFFCVMCIFRYCVYMNVIFTHTYKILRSKMI